MRILIGGGRGFVGTHLTRMLQNKGHEVIHVSRKPQAGAITWNDLYSQGLPAECSAVVNLAGELLMNPAKRWNEAFKNELRRSRLETTSQLVQAIQNADVPPKVFVSSSAVGYYAPSPTEEYTEESPGGEGDFLANLCKDWEEAAKLPENSSTRQVTLRIGLVLGRDGGVIQNLIVPFWLGLGGPISSGKQWFPWIHVDDAAGIITHAIENDHVTGVLNAVAPEAATNAEFTKAFGGALWRPAIFPVPAFVLNCVFGSERAKAMVEGQKVIPQRTLESGYEFMYPDLKSACKEFARLMSADKLTL